MSVFDWESQTTNWVHSWMGVSGVLDFVMAAFSNKGLGTALFVLLGGILFLRFERKRAAHYTALFVAALFAADFVSRHLVKEVIFRPRPRFVKNLCPEPWCFGFVSSHATDFFAVAAVFICIDRRNSIWALPIGILICISRLFLFDHYPLDVVGGALIGFLIGSLFYFLNSKLLNKRRSHEIGIEERRWD